MAERKTPPGEIPEHGTVSRYRYHDCRCDDCRHANTIAKRIERTGDPRRGQRAAQHGTRSKYNAGCKCAPCVRSNREYQREYMASANAAATRAQGRIRVKVLRELAKNYHHEYRHLLAATGSEGRALPAIGDRHYTEYERRANELRAAEGLRPLRRRPWRRPT